MLALRRRTSGERGSALVEVVLVVPFLAVLMLGTLELGMAWRDSMTIATSLRGAARVVTNDGDGRLADYNALKSLEASLSELDEAQIVRIVIFDATTNTDVPIPCTQGTPISGSCNVYVAADLHRDQADFGGTTTCTSSSPDSDWCPLSRDTVQAGGLTKVGVWMRYDRQGITNFEPTDMTITDTAYMNVEPEEA